MVYQYPNFQIKVKIFDPSPLLVYPVGGFSEMWASPPGFFDMTKAKWAAADQVWRAGWALIWTVGRGPKRGAKEAEIGGRASGFGHGRKGKSFFE